MAVAMFAVHAHIGITPGSAPATRLAYPFCHANIFHLAANVYCLIIIARDFRPSLTELLAAYLIAASVPSRLLTDMPTMGLSGLCFALIGMMVWRVRRKLYYNAWASAFAVAGLLIPNVNGWLHVWCLYAGEAIGFLNAPAPWNRK